MCAWEGPLANARGSVRLAGRGAKNARGGNEKLGRFVVFFDGDFQSAQEFLVLAGEANFAVGFMNWLGGRV